MPVVSTMKNGFPPVRLPISAASASPMRPPAASRTSSDRLGRRERVQAQRDRVHGSRAPRRPFLEELRPAERDRERALGDVLRRRRGTFDQVEHRRPEHVHVFEHEDDLSARPETLDERQETALHVLDEDRLLPLGGAEPDREAETRGDPLRLARIAAALHGRPQPARRLVRRHVVLDARDLANDRGHRSERGGVAVGLRPSAEDGDAFVEPGQELVDEPGLAHAGFSEDRDQERAGRGVHPRDAPAQDVHLVGTTHERDRAPSRSRGELLHRIGRERAREPLRLDLLLWDRRRRRPSSGCAWWLPRAPHRASPPSGGAPRR